MAVVEEDPEPILVCPNCLAVFRTGFRVCPHDGEALTLTHVDPLVDKVFAERYHVEELLGAGGLGRVYRARHARMSRRYALKIPYGELAYDPKIRIRFTNEAEAASRLSHPNVISVLDFGETDTGLLYLVMDFAEGRSLSELIEQSGPLKGDWVIRFTRELAMGLAHAHDRGLVHRDLKPDNIIIERDGDRPRIVDFGLAIFHEQEGSRMTTEGTTIGTPAYMAPEQLTGETIDPRTDLFALGLCMYEMLAGVLPFDGSPIGIARQNLAMPVPSIADRAPGVAVDARLEGVCNHLLAKRMADRPISARAVIEMLDQLEAGDDPTWQVSQPPATTPTRDGVALDEARRRRRLAIVAGAAVFAVASVVGWRLLRGHAGAPAVPGDAAVVAMMPPDPAPVPDAATASDTASIAVDANPAPVDARGRLPRIGARTSRADARPRIAAAVDARGTSAAPPPQARVTELYRKVKRSIDDLDTAQGAAVSGPFRKRWKDIPYMDGLGNPSLRPDLITRLRALEADVAAAKK